MSEKWEMWMFQEVRDELCDVLAAGGLETRVQTAIEFGVEALDGLKAEVNTLQANDAATDEIRRLRAQVAELLPWVETSTYAPTALLARIDAGEFGT